MAYGDAYREEVARDIAEILRKSQIRAKDHERVLVKSQYNQGLHHAAMLVHAFKTACRTNSQVDLCKRIEQAIVNAKVKE